MQLIKYLKSKLFIRTVITILIICIVGVWLLTKYLNSTTNHDNKIEVPDLAKMSLTEAHKTLDELSLDTLVMDYASYNPDYPPESIIEQNPEAGDYVKENRKIYLTLNPSSYRKIAIPEVLGKGKRQAVSQLTSAGFKIGSSSYIPDRGRNVVRGITLDGKELKEGDMVAKNSLIDLILGDGNENSSTNNN